MKKSGALVNLANLFFLLAVILAFFKTDYELKSPIAYLAVLVILEAFFIKNVLSQEDNSSIKDTFAIVFAIILLWDVEAKYLKLFHHTILPPPENVFDVFVQAYDQMILGMFHSVAMIVIGVGAGTVAGVFAGLFVGWFVRIRRSLKPIVNVVAAIPALVYAPYVVAIAPTFQAASFSIIFLGVFWPTLMLMMNSVTNIDKKILDSAYALNLSTPTIIFKVLLPYSVMPIMSGLKIQIAMAVMILTMAETIGSSVGLGYYVKKWSDFAVYDKVFAGIILMAVVITGLNKLIDLYESKALKWIR